VVEAKHVYRAAGVEEDVAVELVSLRAVIGIDAIGLRSGERLRADKAGCVAADRARVPVNLGNHAQVVPDAVVNAGAEKCRSRRRTQLQVEQTRIDGVRIAVRVCAEKALELVALAIGEVIAAEA